MANQTEARPPGRMAGILAISGAVIAVLITLPFAAAFYQAYMPGDSPTWLTSLARAFRGLLDFSTDESVYQTYGRIYSIVIPLTLPALILVKKQAGRSPRLSLWGWRIFLGGTVLGGLGILGDYWPETSILVAIGFFLEMLGTLVMWIGSILLGVAAVRNRSPRWIGFAHFSIVPVGTLGFAVLGHIPSGPWLGYVGYCLAMGLRLLARRA